MSTGATVTIRKELMNKISSQMIKLKKQNLNFKEKIKNMKIFMAESLRNSQSLEKQVQEFNGDHLTTTTRYLVKDAEKGSADQTALSSTSPALERRISDLQRALRERDQEIEDLAIGQKRQNLDMQKMRSSLQIKDEEIEVLKQIKVGSTGYKTYDNNFQMEVNEKDREIDNLVKLLSSKDKEINHISKLLDERNDKLKTFSNILEDKDDQIDYLKRAVTSKNEKVDNMADALTKKQEEIQQLCKDLLEKEAEIEKLQRDMEGKSIQDDNNTTIRTDAGSEKPEADELVAKITKLETNLQSRSMELEEKKRKVEELVDSNNEKDEFCEKINIILKEKEKEMDESIRENQQKMEKLINSLNEKDIELEDLSRRLDQALKQLSDSDDKMKSMSELYQKELDALTEELKEKEEQSNREPRANPKKLESLQERVKDLSKKLLKRDNKIDDLETEIEDVKTEYSNIIERLRDERDKITSRMKKDNQILRKEVTALLDQKEELRNHLDQKLNDAERFKKQINMLERDYNSKVIDSKSEFSNYVNETKIKLVKKVKSLLNIIQKLKNEISVMKAKNDNDFQLLVYETKIMLTELKQAAIKQATENKKPGIYSYRDTFGNNSRELTPLSAQKAKGIEADYRSMNVNNKDDKIENLQTLLFEQKEANRKLLEMNYRSEDLSVNTEQQFVEDPDGLEMEVQDLRRLRDRLKHETFGLQSDVDELEEEKERGMVEIEEHETHLNELKEHIEMLEEHRKEMEEEIINLESQKGNQDEVKTLKSQLDETQKLIQRLSSLKSSSNIEGPSSSFESRRISSSTANLKELLNYQPDLPKEAESGKLLINIEGDSINMIIELINNFLEFIKERCAIVYNEYDSYLEILLKLFEASDHNPELKQRLESILHGNGQECNLYKSLLSGNEFVSLLRNLIVKALCEMANVVNSRIMKRRELLLSQREEVEKAYVEFVRVEDEEEISLDAAQENTE